MLNFHILKLQKVFHLFSKIKHPSETDPVEFIYLYWVPKENFTGFPKRTLLGWFIFHLVCLLSCMLPIKAERGGKPYIFYRYENFEHLLHIAVAKRTKR